LNNVPNRFLVSLFCSGHSISSWSIDITIISGVIPKNLFQSINVRCQSWLVWTFQSISSLIVIKMVSHEWNQ
jgi:hypothetical protein